MTLHGSYDILQGDCRDVLATLPDQHFHCCVTSPPYFGLRDYQVDGQIGAEECAEAFIAAIVGVFREVHRVLRDDGVAWLNLGETWRDKRKQFIPERTAIALQDDGWICRDTVIWHKPSPMPGSQRDRCTNAYEFIFQLTKNARYYFDMEAVKEPSAGHNGSRFDCGKTFAVKPTAQVGDRTELPTSTPRNVWTIPHEPCNDAHFAVFPSAIPDKCIRASTSEKGCCPDCGAPYERIVERTAIKRDRPNDYVKRNGQSGTGNSCANTVAGVDATTLGWRPTCGCGAGDPVPCRVIEPFCGAGTTLLAATRLGRDATGIELNPEYIDIARRRIEQALRPSTARSDAVIDSPLFATSTTGPNSGPIPVKLGDGEPASKEGE